MHTSIQTLHFSHHALLRNSLQHAVIHSEYGQFGTNEFTRFQFDLQELSVSVLLCYHQVFPFIPTLFSEELFIDHAEIKA